MLAVESLKYYLNKANNLQLFRKKNFGQTR